MASTEPVSGFPLRTVTRLTGLSPDVIRAWEKRYGVVAPSRGPRGARLYSRDDVEHLRALARAVAGGRTIGDIARLDRAEVRRLARENDAARDSKGAERRPAGETVVERVLAAVQRYDEAAVRTELADCLALLGPTTFVHEIASPFLVRIGELWHAGDVSIAQEHLATGALRNLLHTAIASRRSRHKRPAVLLATVNGEYHEGGLLMAALLLLEQGVELSYLGPQVPALDVVATAKRLEVAAVALSFTTKHDVRHSVAETARIARELPPAIALWLGGSGAAAVLAEIGSDHATLCSLEDLRHRATALRSFGGLDA